MEHALRTYRIKSGISLDTLALSAGVKKSFLSKIERSVARPSVKTIARLVHATNGAVTPNDFMPATPQVLA